MTCRIDKGDVRFVDTDTREFEIVWTFEIRADWRAIYPMEEAGTLDMRHPEPKTRDKAIYILQYGKDPTIIPRIESAIVLVRLLLEQNPRTRRINFNVHRRKLVTVMSCVSGRLYIEILQLLFAECVLGMNQRTARDRMCAICMTPIQQREVSCVCSGYICGHTYHASCMFHYRSPTCPLCRRLMFKPSAVLMDI